MRTGSQPADFAIVLDVESNELAQNKEPILYRLI